MPSFVRFVTVDCAEPRVVAAFRAEALGSDVDEDATDEPVFVESPGWGGPDMWFVRVPEPKTATNRFHFDLRVPGSIADEVARLHGLGATMLREGDDLVVMPDPEGNEFCVE